MRTRTPGVDPISEDILTMDHDPEAAELSLRSRSWLDARLPNGWGTYAFVEGSRVLDFRIVPE